MSQRRIHRILVAVDASPTSLAAAEAAAELAASLEAELEALFVEDVELLRLAELPVARQAGLLSATLRRLESREMELQLRAYAARARHAFERIARRAAIPWSFRVARGLVAAEILAAAGEGRLVALGRTGWSQRQRPRLGSIARRILSEGKGWVLILHGPARIDGPITLVYGGSQAGEEALGVATDIVGKTGQPLQILLLGASEEEAQENRSRLARRLAEKGVPVRFRWLGGNGSRVLDALERVSHGLLVVPIDSPALDEEALLDLCGEADCPVLAVR